MGDETNIGEVNAGFESREPERKRFDFGLSTVLAFEAGQESLLADDSTLTVNILRQWDRARVERFALHLLGDAHQNLVAAAEAWGDVQRGTPCECGEPRCAANTALRQAVADLRRARDGGEGSII